MDPLKRQTATATPAEPGGLFDFARQREIGPPSPDQRLQIKLAPVVAFASRLHSIPLTPRALGGEAPACSECVPEGLDCH